VIPLIGFLTLLLWLEVVKDVCNVLVPLSGLPVCSKSRPAKVTVLERIWLLLWGEEFKVAVSLVMGGGFLSIF